MSRTIYQVDAFTSAAFAGNPAGVCVLDASQPDHWLQAVAAEMNLSETAFLIGSGVEWNLRWFTPACEVDLCGHATLASAHVLWESGIAAGDELRFDTLSGELRATREGKRIALDFPSEPPAQADGALHDALAGYDVLWTGRNRMDYFVEVASAQQVRTLLPDLQKLAHVHARGLIITAASDDGRYDFVSRWFGPAVGVDEDPVTGSAHCALGPYWMQRLGKRELTGFQASRRGGVVGVRVRDDRVTLLGEAVTVLRGELFA